MENKNVKENNKIKNKKDNKLNTKKSMNKKKEEKRENKIKNKIENKIENKKENKKEKDKEILNKNLSEDEKRRQIIEKQQKYVEDMAKKRTFDKEYMDSVRKEYKDKKIKEKNSNFEKRYFLIGTLLIVLLFLGATYLSNPEKFSIKKLIKNKQEENIKKGYLPESERVEKIHEILNKRKSEFNALILNQEKPMPFPEKFEIEKVIDEIKEKKLVIPEVDEIKDNYIFIGDTYIKIEDLSVIFKDKYLASKQKAEVKELIDLDEDKPNIIIAKKFGLYTKNGELIVNIADGLPQNFDGYVDKNENPIVIAYDKTDGDLTEQMTFTPELKNLEDGKIYTLKYTVTNSKGETAEREFNIKCVNIMKGLKN